MDLNSIDEIDLDKLEQELNNERLDFKEVANYFSNLNIVQDINQNNSDFHYKQTLKLIRIYQILLKYSSDKLTKIELGDRFVFQCTNCSKAFRKSEYLENHIQRRHGTKSLADNGLFPLIEQIKRYNSGLFVESSSIDDLKDEIKNLQTCLKETSEDLIKEKIAREQLQRIIESEIIEKLNSLQETWSEPKINREDENNLKESNDEIDESKNKLIQSTELNEKNSFDTKDAKDFNLFLTKQNELIEKLGQNIDRFVERNDETKLSDEQLQKFISSTIHKEIESLLMNKEEIWNDKKDMKEIIKTKKSNNRLFSLNKKETMKSNLKENEFKKLNLHEFSIQNQNENQLIDHTDEIVHEINEMINDETLIKQQNQIKSSSISLTSRIKKSIPFKFRKSKSLQNFQSNNELIKNESNWIMKQNELSNHTINNLTKNMNELNEKNNNENKDELKLNEKTNSIVDKINQSKSRFRPFVWKKNDNNDQENKINLNRFSSKEKRLDEMNKKSNDLNDENTNVKQLINQIDKNIIVSSSNESNGNKVLKSVLKKSNSTDNNLINNKLPKKTIAFSDERIEFSAEDSDTSSSHSIVDHQQNDLNQFNYTIQPTEPIDQIITVQKVVQKVIEKPIPAPRLIQQSKTLTSL